MRRRSLGDLALDLLLAGFAGWTLVYHVCVVARASTTVALIAWAAVLALGVAAVLRGRPERPDAEPPEPGFAVPAPVVIRGAGVLLALAAAALFAFVKDIDWPIVWALWVAAAACGAVSLLAGRARVDMSTRARPGEAVVERLVTAAWMLALAALALMTLNPDDDDSYYVRLTGWIADNGVFPHRDIMFSDEVLPALYHPPVGSFDPLVGSLARLTTIATPAFVYFVVAPAVAALAVLALRRLLRSWGVALPAVALTVALGFLLANSQANQTFGSFFIGRAWQGKTVLLIVLVPLLFALLHDFGQRPSRAGAARLAAAGIAGVGLSTTGIFLVPVIAAGCAAAIALRSWRTAAAALALTTAYPVGAAVVTKALGGRVPDQYVDADVIAPDLVHLVLFRDEFALLAVGALLIAPAFINRTLAARMVAAVVLIVAVLYAPGLPVTIFHLTDLGRVLWRLNWAIPVAALVGVLAVGLVRARWPLGLRVLPAALLIGFFILAGRPPWDDQSARGLEWPPVFKRFPEELAAARTVTRAAQPGDLVYATRKVSQTVGILATDVTTVNPRGFFTTALADEPAALVAERKQLHFYTYAVKEPVPGPRLLADVGRLGVDLTCMPRELDAILAVLRDAGWSEVAAGAGVTCLRPG